MFNDNKYTAAAVLIISCVLLVIPAGGCAEKNTHEQVPPAVDLNVNQETAQQQKKIKVVTTIFPLADIIGQVGGEGVEVTSLLVAGASPHTYEPSVEQAKAVANADIVVYIGGGLDDWVLKPAEGTRQARLLEIMGHMQDLLLGYDPLHLPYEEGHRHSHDNKHGHGHEHDDGHEHGHDAEYDYGHHHGPHDPHIWLDPLLVRDLVAPLLAAELSAVNSEWQSVFQENLARFQVALTQLHEEIEALVGGFKHKRFISYHSAWNYYARRYGLEEVAAVEEFPGKEPSARWMAELVRLAAQYEIKVLFAEPQLGGNTAAVIAREIGGEVLLLDPLGGEGVPGRSDYISLLRYNTQMLTRALGPGTDQ